MSRIELLIARSQAGDMEAKELLINENSGLIWSIAKRYIGRGTEPDDLYQLACLGFLKAVDGFDLQFGTQFSTYAVPKISGEIRRFLRDDGVIKVSRGMKERSASIHTARNQLTNSLGRDPTLTEIAEYTGLTAEDIVMAESATACVESIHQTTGEDGFSLEHVLTDSKTEDMFIEQMALRQAIEKLPERELIVIKLRFFHGLTQQRVAKVLKVSQVQVSRIEKKALEKLRNFMT